MSSLYLAHFGLASPPFSITPDPSFFFEGKDRGVFIDGLLHATLQAEGIVTVIGEVGSGKTLMSRILLSRLPEYVDTVYLPNPAFSRDEIIEVIARDLGLEGGGQGHGLRLEALQLELIRRHEQSRKVVVLIDEAHAMPMESIEEVRRLSNLETDNHKLVQVILCGQPELDTLLAAPHLRQVRDRVVYRLALGSLSKEDSLAYLDHRLRVAGWRGSRMFSWWAERLLLRDAKGRARRLNILADKALLAAYADNQKRVLARHVRLAIRDAGANFATLATGRLRPWGWLAAWSASLAVAVCGTLWFGLSTAQNRSETLPSVPSPVAVVPPSPPSPPTLPKVDPPANPMSGIADPAAVAAGQGREIAAVPTPATPAPPQADDSAGPARPAGVAAGLPLPDDIDSRVKQSRAYALEQAATSHYAIRLSSISLAEKALAFMKSAAEMLPPGQLCVRRTGDGGEMDSAQASYIIYFGSFPSHDAAGQAITALPEKLQKDNPTIRTWKEISDAPWSL